MVWTGTVARMLFVAGFCFAYLLLRFLCFSFSVVPAPFPFFSGLSLRSFVSFSLVTAKKFLEALLGDCFFGTSSLCGHAMFMFSFSVSFSVSFA